MLLKIPKEQNQLDLDTDDYLANLIDESAKLDEEITRKTEKLKSNKEEVADLFKHKQIIVGKYVTENGNTMTVTEAKAYEDCDAQGVFDYIMNNDLYSYFGTLFKVGYTKLGEIIGKDKAAEFRKEKEEKTLKLSFK